MGAKSTSVLPQPLHVVSPFFLGLTVLPHSKQMKRLTLRLHGRSKQWQGRREPGWGGSGRSWA